MTIADMIVKLLAIEDQSLPVLLVVASDAPFGAGVALDHVDGMVATISAYPALGLTAPSNDVLLLAPRASGFNTTLAAALAAQAEE
jgi:hypothetical protein